MGKNMENAHGHWVSTGWGGYREHGPGLLVRS